MKNSDIFYSVEYIDKHALFNCWNQYVLTGSKFYARLSLFELKMRSRAKSFRYRVREL